MAVDDDVVVIGATSDGEAGSLAGAVYVLRRNVSTGFWEQVQKLLPSGTSPQINGGKFGQVVDIQGDLIMIGAPEDNTVSSDAGAAYVFRFNAITMLWEMEEKLTASDGASGDQFGLAIAIRGDVCAVGAPWHDEGGVSNSGAAYVYRFDLPTTTWNQEADLSSSVLRSSGWFASSVAFNDDFLAVGDYRHLGASGALGRVRMYEFDGVNWVIHSNLEIAGAPDDQLFGINIALDGNRMAAGASPTFPFRILGDVYIFEFDGALWNQTHTLLACLGANISSTRSSLDLVGDWLLLGAGGDDQLAGVVTRDAGIAYTFHFDGVNWAQEETLFLPQREEDDHFGNAVALWNDEAIVGAWGEDVVATNAGLAYVFSDLTNTDYVGNDCNNNGISDRCEIADGLITDCDANKIPDVCDLAGGYVVDCNLNGISDFCDIRGGVSEDCNDNAIPDECDSALGDLVDCNANIIHDPCETTDYMIDDGNFDLDWRTVGGTWEWFNQYTVQPGAESITSIAMVWPAFAPDGHSVELRLYDDPDNDGDLTDRVLLHSAIVLSIQSGSGSTIDRHTIPQTFVGNAGDSFFVSIRIVDADGRFVLSDADDVQNRSVYINPSSEVIAFDHNLVLRADATHPQGIPSDCLSRGDSNGDGTVNVNDLLNLLISWGACPAWPVPCPADTDGDDQINVNDLLTMLGNWDPI